MKQLIHAALALVAGLLLGAAAAAQAKPLPGPDVPKVYERLLKQID